MWICNLLWQLRETISSVMWVRRKHLVRSFVCWEDKVFHSVHPTLSSAASRPSQKVEKVTSWFSWSLRLWIGHAITCCTDSTSSPSIFLMLLKFSFRSTRTKQFNDTPKCHCKLQLHLPKGLLVPIIFCHHPLVMIECDHFRVPIGGH